MAIGNNDDFVDEMDDFSPDEVEETLDIQLSDNYIDRTLKDIGIDDPSRIKFEDENGNIEERSWGSLTDDEKYEVLNTPYMEQPTDEDDLDDDEVSLLNSIRASGMSPKDYFAMVQRNAAQQAVNNAQPQTPLYAVDEYNDDELFVADLITRMPDISQDEAREALENAKSNETLYLKQIKALREEYTTLEKEQQQQLQYEAQVQQQQRFKQFSDAIANEINSLTDIQGYDLGLDSYDMNQLYDFITGYRQDGQNHFAAALANPKTLVKTAYFALNGEQMIDQITDYFKNEIKNVRKSSYAKGYQDGQNGNRSLVVFGNGRNNSYRQSTIDDDF